jgi:sugar phosphate isomerase/epimerase
MTSTRPDVVSLSAWKLPLDAALARAKAVGAARVDLIAIPSWRQLDPAQLVRDPRGWAARIARLLHRHGLGVATLNAAVPDPHRWGTPARRRAMLAQSEALAVVASALGARVVSLYPGYHHQGPIDLAPLIAACRAWVAIGRRHGVHLAPEIHWHTVAPDPAAARTLLAAVPGLRLVFDPSHALIAGIPLADWFPLLPHVVHVHLRDAAPGRLDVPWGTGALDPDALCAALTTAGYRGHIAAEVLPNGGEAALRLMLAALGPADPSSHTNDAPCKPG